MANIPKEMKALVLTGKGKYVIKRVPVPTMGPDEVLCRIRAVAICGSDPAIVSGEFAGGTIPASYPFIPGHEWAGEIVAKGEKVVGFEVGDRVAGEAHKGCGFCEMCMQGRYNLCLNFGNRESGHRWYGFLNQGAYAEYNVYSIKAVHKLPSNISFEEGTMVDTAATALHGLQRAGMKAGATVLVIGPGPVGLLTAKLANILGASQVIIAGRGHNGRSHRMELAKRIGITIDVEKEDLIAKVKSLTNGKGADLTVECAGAAAEEAIRATRKGGDVVLIGNYVKPVLVPLSEVVFNELRILGSRADPNTCDVVIRLLAARKLEVEDLITHSFSLDDFGKALKTFTQRLDGAIKVVVRID